MSAEEKVREVLLNEVSGATIRDRVVRNCLGRPYLFICLSSSPDPEGAIIVKGYDKDEHFNRLISAMTEYTENRLNKAKEANALLSAMAAGG